MNTSNWISVEDHLPMDCEEVIFYTGNTIDRPSIKMGIYLAGCQTFETELEDDWHGACVVTHWMKLPKEPEHV